MVVHAVSEEAAGELLSTEFAAASFHLCFYAVVVTVAGDNCGDDDAAVFPVEGRIVSNSDAIKVCF